MDVAIVMLRNRKLLFSVDGDSCFTEITFMVFIERNAELGE